MFQTLKVISKKLPNWGKMGNLGAVWGILGCMRDPKLRIDRSMVVFVFPYHSKSLTCEIEAGL